MIDLKHLRALSTLHDAGSMARAAERLHLTPSALSHQLRALEAYLGSELVSRKQRPLRFTPAGQRLLALSGEVLPAVARAERDLRHLAQGAAGRLHIAIECHSCIEWLMPAMDAYRAAWPRVEMDISMAHSFEPLTALQHGDVDAVITADPVDGLDIAYTPLFRYEVVLAVAGQHALAARRSIAPEDLADQTLLTYPVEPERLDVFGGFLDPAGIRPTAVRTSALTAMILQLVASGRGVAALPNWALSAARVQGQIVARPLSDGGLWATLYGACRAADAELAYVDAFFSTARETCFATLEGVRPV